MASSGNLSGGQSAKPKKSGFFDKLKQALTPGSSGRSIASRSRSREDDRESLGTTATRTRSRMSMFGGMREAKEAQEAERLLEERKSKCVAIKVATREPPSVQRLLVDCEFCNPPPQFGRDISVQSPKFTSAATAASIQHVEALKEASADMSDERTWNVGLDEWIRMREWWLTPTPDAQPIHHLDADLTPDRYYTVYDKMVYKTRPLKHPLNLADVTKIIKAGWIGEGTWPQAGDNAWSTSDGQNSLATPGPIAPILTPTNAPPYSSSSTQGTQAVLTAPQEAQANNTQTERTDASGPNGPTSQSSEQIHTNGVEPPGSTPSDSEANDELSEGPDEGTGEGTSESRDLPRIHVQFSNKPHPREKEPGDSLKMPKLERVQSAVGVPIRPIRSAHSSIVSITDSE